MYIKRNKVACIYTTFNVNNRRLCLLHGTLIPFGNISLVVSPQPIWYALTHNLKWFPKIPNFSGWLQRLVYNSRHFPTRAAKMINSVFSIDIWINYLNQISPFWFKPHSDNIFALLFFNLYGKDGNAREYEIRSRGGTCDKTVVWCRVSSARELWRETLDQNLSLAIIWLSNSLHHVPTNWRRG